MIATSMRPQNIAQSSMRRMLRSTRVARVPARQALATGAAAVFLALSPLAHACGYHDAASTGVGMLNWAYPDSLHVRTAVWMAQDGGLLAAREPPPTTDPLSANIRLQQMVRWRETQARLGTVQGRIQAALEGQPMPAFAVLLIGPMLWTRFEGKDGGVTMIPHAAGPAQGDVVLVSDEAVMSALADGRITAREARAEGLVKAYGTREDIDRVSALLDRAFEPK